jgi:ketosteroid isomerase-like protein
MPTLHRLAPVVRSADLGPIAWGRSARSLFIRVAMLFAFLSTPVIAQSREGSDPRDVEAVKATMVAMWAAIEAGDAAQYATYIHPTFTQFGENDTYLAEGKAEEVRSIASYVQRAKQVHTVMHQPDVTVRGAVAWVTYYWTDEGFVDGKRFTSRGKSTRIFVKEGGRWLCIHGHYTAVP